jgi:hypothetical protein
MKGIKDLFKGFSKLWYGDGAEQSQKPIAAQDLQEAVGMKIQAADAKGDAASVQMVSAKAAYNELAKLVVQHDELMKQAKLAEKAGDHEKAKRILALALAVKGKIDKASERYEQSNKVATQLIQEAQQKFKEAKEASSDLPRKVLQLEVNRMLENANRLEGKAQERLSSKPSYEALAASIDMQTERHLIRNVIEDGGETIDGEINQVLKEAQFDKEYKRLQLEAQSPDEFVEAEILTDQTTDRAKQLLSQAPFGGLLSQFSGTAAYKQPVKVKVENEGKK